MDAGSQHLIRARSPLPADARVVAELVNSCTLEDVSLATYTPEAVRKTWAEGGPERFVVLETGDGIMAYLEIEVDDRAELYFEGFVHPERRGRGLGARIIDSAEERARAMGHGVRVVSNCSARAAARLFESRGYERVAHEYAMFLDLRRVPEARWPESVRARDFVEGRDDELFFRIIRAAFGDDWEEGEDPRAWLEARRRMETYDPGLWFFAEREGEAVGAVEARSWWGAQTDTGHLKYLAVVPEARTLGIGRALVYEAATRMAARGRRRVVLGVAVANPTAAPEFYRRIGMYVGGESFDYARLL
ncbi:MAG: GNAT family N-acetyltransferase [Actinomycetota bacterium]